MSRVVCLRAQDRPWTLVPSARPGSRPMKLAPHGPPRLRFAAPLAPAFLPADVLPVAVWSVMTGVAVARAIFLVSSGFIRLLPVSLCGGSAPPIASSRRSYAIVRPWPVDRSVSGLGGVPLPVHRLVRSGLSEGAGNMGVRPVNDTAWRGPESIAKHKMLWSVWGPCRYMLWNGTPRPSPPDPRS